MAGIRLEWAQFGDFDSFDVIRSDTSMANIADADLPSPIAAGLKTMYYVDAIDIIVGFTYYYRVRVWRDNVSFLSEEISKLAGMLWTPNNLESTPKIWFNSSDIVADSSNLVSQLTDMSGNNYHATQIQDKNKPTISDGTVKFDGSTDYMSISSSANNLMRNINKAWVLSVFSKERLDTSNAERPIITFANNTQGYRVGLNIGQVSSNRNILFFGGRRLDSEPYAGTFMPTEIKAGQTYIGLGYVDYSTNTTRLWVDGALAGENINTFTAAGSTSNTASSRANVGSNLVLNPTAFGDVSVSAILVGNTQLSTLDRQKLEGWAAHKYGLIDNLPIDHPYKNIPPIL